MIRPSSSRTRRRILCWIRSPAWERQFKKSKAKDEQSLDMTKDKIAGKPRPKGARPMKTWIAWDCRDAAAIRDEAIFRGMTEREIVKSFLESMHRDIRREDRPNA